MKKCSFPPNIKLPIDAEAAERILKVIYYLPCIHRGPTSAKWVTLKTGSGNDCMNFSPSEFNMVTLKNKSGIRVLKQNGLWVYTYNSKIINWVFWYFRQLQDFMVLQNWFEYKVSLDERKKIRKYLIRRLNRHLSSRPHLFK